MVEIYCIGKKHERSRLLSHVEVCEECSALLDYAYQRLDHCKFLNESSGKAERGENFGRRWQS